MAALFQGLSGSALRTLADAFRHGRLSASASALAITRICACSQDSVADLQRLLGEGMAPAHLALLLDASAESLERPIAVARAVELVWTGPEGAGAYFRDTSVVVRDLFASAQRSVLVSTFVVNQAGTMFEALGQRLDDVPDLQAQVFLHVARGPRDTRYEVEILREFATKFRKVWPGKRLPDVFYDPRGLAEKPEDRATWHAKCVVVDDDAAFVTSANLTDWAQHRNVEAGVLVRDRQLVAQLRDQFDGLVRTQQVRRIPGL
jgi:phosphatidylserine/phosphatidylglycerophosphate/cardiolipin synthase-like enzyme